MQGENCEEETESLNLERESKKAQARYMQNDRSPTFCRTKQNSKGTGRKEKEKKKKKEKKREEEPRKEKEVERKKKRKKE